MKITGDIALPSASLLNIDMPDELKNGIWIGNLEGTLIKNENDLIVKNVVFNNYDGVRNLLNTLPFKAFSVANNHILDVSPFLVTKRNLQELGVLYFGAGENLVEASEPLILREGKHEYAIFSFGWNCIKCKYANRKKEGVNPYKQNHVLSSVKKMIDRDKSKKVLCLFHWNYELEVLPSPYDRQLSKKLIDLGVYAVIGCHSHCAQQIELYKGKPIVYSLGNFLFPHNIFWNEKLNFPDYTNKELVFEINENGDFITHWFYFDPRENMCRYIDSDNISQNTSSFKGRAEYSSFSNKEYEAFFLKNRHQRKMLPVFMSNQSILSYYLKSQWVRVRGKLIDLLVMSNMKLKNRT